MKFNACHESFETKILPEFGDEKITVTNRMLLKNGKLVIPVMGEMHYSRILAHRWEEELIKMKQGGIDIIGSYVFWIHHEENKGQFDFSGSRDIRRFIKLCHKAGLEFFLRIGPWAHGECRNGGFPYWLCQECGDTLRTEKEPYFSYVKRYIKAVAEQVKDLPLIGIQIENEMVNRPEYLEKVRQIAMDEGLHAPLMTATAWGNAVLPKTLLPMFSGYPETPWIQNIEPMQGNPNYFFSVQREDGNVGADLLGETKTEGDPYIGLFPKLTCEVGAGNQVTYHRRPFFSAADIVSMAVVKIGSGVNMLGYYMYHGGINPMGKTTMQESRETGYPNDYPALSYDFQAPIGDQGQLRKSYFELSRIHRFLHSFGEMLAPMDAVMPDVMPRDLYDLDTLSCAVRADKNGGFLFVNNHTHISKMPAHADEKFEFVFQEKTVHLALDIPSDSCFIMPIHLTLNHLSFDYITAQPVDVSENTLTLAVIPHILPRVQLTDGRMIALHEGINKIENTEILLEKPLIYEPAPLKPLGVRPVKASYSPDILLKHLHLPDLTLEYEISWEEGTTFIAIRAKGDLAGFIGDGKLISDFYLYEGDMWVIDVRDLKCRTGRIIYQPFSEEARKKVYLESPFSIGIQPVFAGSTCEKVLFI